MQQKTRTILLGAAIGTAVCGLLALPSQLPAAMASEEPAVTLLKTGQDIFPPPVNLEGLYKPNSITDGTVSREVRNQSVVRKIAFGYTSYVTIVRTPTGVYSTDGLQSPHVRYPGIHITAPNDDGDHAIGELALWDGSSWVAFGDLDARSFFDLPGLEPSAPEAEPLAGVPVAPLPITPLFEDEDELEEDGPAARSYTHPGTLFPTPDDPDVGEIDGTPEGDEPADIVRL